ncbi:hypothetical protein FA15DRAFT_593600, partial [Coprinopsis marcescibilis]
MSSPHIEQVGVRARYVTLRQRLCDILTTNLPGIFTASSLTAKYADPFDFYLEAGRFVKLVLGLTSNNLQLDGFDESITWGEDSGSKKARGKLATVDAEGNSVTYDITGDEPSFYRQTISRRATTTWDVTGPNGEEYLVKDVWQMIGQEPHCEHELLAAAKNIVGVAQMIAFEDICDTSDYRDLQGHELFKDRTKCRLTLERYGPSIVNFQSASQALKALHDAISAHKELFKAGILHGDISINNILLGQPNAEPGWRGVLIDLDMAKLVNDVEGTDPRTGTCMFQSISVLTTIGRELHQDQYDDLESFFYVLCYLLCRF